MYTEGKNIKANITIRSSYKDEIWIKVQDEASGVTFIDITMTREAFINATMNQLASAPVKEAMVHHLDKVGKRHEMKPFEFELPEGTTCFNQKEVAKQMVASVTPKGWRADNDFGSQTSFRSKGEKIIAHTMIRRWV